MKAAKTDSHPDFLLMKQSDIVSFFHLQMPRWLFSHEKYKSLSLEAKVAYTFLLNRFQLSRLNGWVNDSGEVFVIFTRESLADEMQISYKKAIAAFQSLVAAKLIWEKRVGRGNANQIYLALVELPVSDAGKHTAAPFGNAGARPAETEHPEAGKNTCTGLKPVLDELQEVPKTDIKTCQRCSSRPADSAHSDLPNLHPSKKEKSYNDMSVTEKVSPSVSAGARGDPHRQTKEDENEFEQLLENCELWVLPEEVQPVFENAIERLFFSTSFTVGKATLPQTRVRSHLRRMDGMVAQDAYRKLCANTEHKIKNSTAYVMSTIFNAIQELQSDLLVDPFLNAMAHSGPPGKKGRAWI